MTAEATEWQLDRVRHVEYLMGVNFEDLMRDMYIGTGNPTRPPFIEDIMEQVFEGHLIVQDRNRDFFVEGATEDEMMYLLAQMREEDIWKVERDVYTYIHQNRLFVFYDKGLGTKNLYAPVVSTW